MICKLCQQEKELCDSHIIPSFVFKWLKNSSATGFLRQSKNPNKRVEDGKKSNLLCKDCEAIFNKYETDFSKEIFYPYINYELSKEGVAQGNIKEFRYDLWLLKFIISVQWRLSNDNSWEKLKPNQKKKVEEFKIIARDFLLDKRNDTGSNETHLFFLQNLAYANGYFPDNLNVSVNRYLLRAIDGTAFFTGKYIGIYCKLGPIVLITSLIPSRLKETSDSKIHLRGTLKTSQKVYNAMINKFMYIDRPNEAMNQFVISEKQLSIIKKTSRDNIERTMQSLSIQASLGDKMLKEKIKIQKNFN